MLRHRPPIPGPLYALARDIASLIAHHQALAVGAVIGLEEVGVPLPVPGDVFLLYTGYLVAKGRIAFWPAVLAVTIGAVLGASGLYWLARRLGSGLVVRYGHLVNLDERRLRQAERLFRRYGPPVIIFGRYVPGMRVVLSAIAGLLRVSYPLFAISVAISAFIWAVVLLEIGRRVGRRVDGLLHVTPAHTVPALIFLFILLILAVVAWRRSRSVTSSRRDL